MEKLLKNISLEDLDKLRMLFSIIPQTEQKEVVTLRVFVEEYCDLIKHNRSKAYYESVIYSLKHLTDFFGSQRSIQSLGFREIETFIIHLQQKVSKGYRVYYRTMKAAFNKAVDWGYVKENYFVKVKLPKRQKMAPVFINSNQLSAISNKLKSETAKDFVMIAFYTGMRLDEIVNLRWTNVDLQNRVITVGDEKFTTKGRNQRFVPISEEAWEMLYRKQESEISSKKTQNFSEHMVTDTRVIGLNKKVGDSSPDCIGIRMTNEYVFCKPDGQRYTGDHISQSFKRACKDAGVDKAIHFHSLRHSFASNLVQKGISLYTIKELLGHSSISTTEIYSHLNMDTLREAINKFDESEEGQGKRQTEKVKNIDPQELKIFRINDGEIK